MVCSATLQIVRTKMSHGVKAAEMAGKQRVLTRRPGAAVTAMRHPAESKRPKSMGL